MPPRAGSADTSAWGSPVKPLAGVGHELQYRQTKPTRQDGYAVWGAGLMYGSGGGGIRAVVGTGAIGTTLALTGFPTFAFILLGLMLVLLGAALVRVGAMRRFNAPDGFSSAVTHPDGGPDLNARQLS